MSNGIELSLNSTSLRGFSGRFSSSDAPVSTDSSRNFDAYRYSRKFPVRFDHGRSVPIFVDSIAPAQSLRLGEVQGIIALSRNVFAAERLSRSLSAISQNISSETWRIVVAHHLRSMLGSNWPEENCGFSWGREGLRIRCLEDTVRIWFHRRCGEKGQLSVGRLEKGVHVI